jgi:hypothetical protein
MNRRARWSMRLRWVTVGMVALGAVGCGGGNISNPPETTGQSLSFTYYQKCIDPVLQAQLQVNQGGSISTNSCAGSGCHSSVNGTGGALRLVQGAAPVPAGTAVDAVRASDMYKNFFSSQGSSIPGSPTESRMLKKPLVQGVLPGGGLIFTTTRDPNARLIQYCISRPAPAGQDEFANADSMFTPPNAATGTCNTS